MINYSYFNGRWNLSWFDELGQDRCLTEQLVALMMGWA